MPADCLVCAAPLGPPEIAARDRLHGGAGEYGVATCSRCTAGRTLPPAAATELAAFYPEEYGPYARPRSVVERAISAGIQRWQGWLARHSAPMNALAALPPARMLDVGCGRGDLAAMFVQRGWRVTGIEPSAGACAVARARGIDAREGVLAIVELDPGAYDGAVFQQSLEHTEEPLADLRRTYRALRPGATLCVSVPNFGSWQAQRFGDRWFHLDVPRHRAHFTAYALAKALQLAGFADIRISTSTSSVGLPASIQYLIAGRCLAPSGLRLRVAAGVCVLTVPFAWVLNRLSGGGDVLHAVGVKPAG